MPLSEGQAHRGSRSSGSLVCKAGREHRSCSRWRTTFPSSGERSHVLTAFAAGVFPPAHLHRGSDEPRNGCRVRGFFAGGPTGEVSAVVIGRRVACDGRLFCGVGVAASKDGCVTNGRKSQRSHRSGKPPRRAVSRVPRALVVFSRILTRMPPSGRSGELAESRLAGLTLRLANTVPGRAEFATTLRAFSKFCGWHCRKMQTAAHGSPGRTTLADSRHP